MCEARAILYGVCELLLISSARAARLDLSLEALASHGAPSGLNRDGWGVASYQRRDVRLMKEATPALDSELVRFIERHEHWSTAVLFHLRHAVTGGISYENTQPFVRERGGRAHVFCHNGDVSDACPALERELDAFRPLGETDSEIAFCALLGRLQERWRAASGGVPRLDDRFAVVAEMAAELRAAGVANFLYADGDAVFVHAHWRPKHGRGSPPMPGLSVLEGACEFCGPPFTLGDTCGDLFVAASVPLSEGAWRPLAEGELLAVRGGRVVQQARP